MVGVSRLVERDDWSVEERDRLRRALAEAMLWQRLEPHKADYWDTFDQKLLAGYPEVRFEEREPQTQLGDFGGGASA